MSILEEPVCGLPQEVEVAWRRAREVMTDWSLKDDATRQTWVDVFGGSCQERKYRGRTYDDLNDVFLLVAKIAQWAVKVVIDALTVTEKWIAAEAEVVVKSHALATIEDASAIHAEKALSKADEIIQACSQVKEMCQTEVNATVARKELKSYAHANFNVLHSSEMISAVDEAFSALQTKSIEAVKFIGSLHRQPIQIE
jgi:hypothetical protein